VGIDDPRGWTYVRADIPVGSNGDKHPVFDGHGARRAKRGVDGEHLAIHDYKIGRRGRGGRGSHAGDEASQDTENTSRTK
jgi:hypothetical protein